MIHNSIQVKSPKGVQEYDFKIFGVDATYYEWPLDIPCYLSIPESLCKKTTEHPYCECGNSQAFHDVGSTFHPSFFDIRSTEQNLIKNIEKTITEFKYENPDSSVHVSIVRPIGYKNLVAIFCTHVKCEIDTRYFPPDNQDEKYYDVKTHKNLAFEMEVSCTVFKYCSHPLKVLGL